MNDKTALERDLERHENNKVPVDIYILIAILLIAVGVMSMFTLNMMQELADKTREYIVIKETYKKEKSEMLGKIMELEHETSGQCYKYWSIRPHYKGLEAD